MASVAHLRVDAENIIDEIERRYHEVQENAQRMHVLTRDLQRVFRGYVTRKHLNILNSKATVIQKNWRGFVGRNLHRARLKERYDEMCWAYYNEMGTRIQKVWKGFWVRTRVFSYYELKAWLAFVAQRNKMLKNSMANYKDERYAADMKQRESEAKEWIIYILFKLHHLVRTKQINGIYSLPNKATLSEIEKMLNSLKYIDFMRFYNSYMDDVRKKKAQEIPAYILQNCKYPAHFEREWYEHKKPHKNLIFTRGPYLNPNKYHLPELQSVCPSTPNDICCFELRCEHHLL